MPNWKKVIVSGSDAVLNSLKTTTNITSSNISASGNLFANISNNSSTSFKTVVVDPSTGQLYRTGSYGGGGGGGGTGNGFPFEGDALITGSLTISQSYTAGDTDSTALRLIGSGSVSQSGIFEVEGSAGPLFSVADGLDGVLMEVNNISGLPLFQVSSSNEVFINRGNLTSGVTTATASFAYFTGSFAGDASGLTNVPAGSTPTLDAVTTAGNVTSNAITAGTISGSSFKLNNANALSHTGNVLYVGNANDWTTIELGRETTDEIHVNGLLKAEQLLRAEQSAQITGSLNVSGSIDIEMPSGSAFTIHEGDASTNYENRLDFFYDESDPTLEIAARAATSTLILSKDGGGSYKTTLTGLGTLTYKAAGTDYGVQLGTAFKPVATNQQDLGFYNRRWKNLYLYSTNKIGWGTTNANEHAAFAHTSGTGKITLESDVYTPIFELNGPITASAFKGDGSQLTNLPDPFPFTGNAGITGSLSITGSGGLSVESSGSTVFEVIGSEGTLFSIDDDLDGVIFTANDRSGLPVLEASASGEVYIGKSPQSLYTTAVISSNNANVTQSIYGLDTSSYGGAFFEYTAHSGSNARAGNIMSVWNGSSLNFTETTTTDIGSTSDLVMKVHVSESQAQLAAFSTNAGYNIKTIIKSI